MTILKEVKANIIAIIGSWYGNCYDNTCDYDNDITFLCKSNLDNYYTLTILRIEQIYTNDWCDDNIGYYSEIQWYNIKPDDLNEIFEYKITHWINGNHSINIDFIEKYNYDERGYFTFSVIDIDNYGDEYDPGTRLFLNEKLSLSEFDIFNERKKFIAAISEELISVVYSPDRIKHWLHFEKEIDISNFSDSFKFIEV
jgi:hypothetical protein